MAIFDYSKDQCIDPQKTSELQLLYDKFWPGSIVCNQQGWDRYQNAPNEAKSVANICFNSNYDCIKSAYHHDVDLVDTKLLFDFFFQLGDVKIPYDFLDTVTNDDVVEVYAPNGVQVLRSKRMLTLVSYSEVELTSFRFDDLFGRSKEIKKVVDDGAFRLLSTNAKIVDLDIPKHFVRELIGPSKRGFTLKFKYGAPLFSAKSDERLGFVVSASANTSMMN